MRDYEIIFIVHPELDETNFTETVEKVQGWIIESGGTITKTDIWGKRRMAYAIRKQREGQYVYLNANIEPSFVRELERNFRFQEPVMRFLITSLN